MEGRRVERENCPRDHRELSQDIASISTVFCSTGTILWGKGYGARSNGGYKKAQAHPAGKTSSPNCRRRDGGEGLRRRPGGPGRTRRLLGELFLFVAAIGERIPKGGGG